MPAEGASTLAHVINEVVEGLVAVGVPREMAEACRALTPDAQGVLVYGSRARGDAVEGSDLDLLALVAGARPSDNIGDVNISHYTLDQLSTGVGTLFGAHLKRDARIVWDPTGNLYSAVANLGDVDTDRLLGRAKRMSELFTSPERDLPKYLEGLLREARYLLRSCLYAQAIADGSPCFSVRQLATRHQDKPLAQLLASRQPGDPSMDDLNECLTRLRRIIGEFPVSQHGSLEATIVNEWDRPGDLLSMAFMALGVTGQGSDYAEIERILL